MDLLTTQYVRAFPDVRVTAADPGLTSTDAAGGVGRPVTDGVTAILTAVLDPHRAPSGACTIAEGPVPW